MEEVRIASSSSSPSRHLRSLPRPGSRGLSRIGFGLGHASGSGDVEEDPHPVFINGVLSNATSRHTSPWASTAVSPVSTPASSAVHGYFDSESPPQRSPERKRTSWLGSMPASYFTPHRASDASSPPPPVCPRSGKRQRSSASSSSSISSSPATGVESKVESGALSLVPNAQFLGLMLLMILIISSPLIKVLSVLLFVAIVVLDDA
ncbi:uncharacterized protein SRS1_10712 [Sporisorium reilianum f. sp. reilianum]|uniref:Uncharacterized protein n=1 Tax=Sporisorium reilianum f. sp. reilianum TaxID=72559 RepID=A0A2N8UBF8_9BASI|nr:uncharacterized protein SRS1_10712 [Sporisorium reilianum f. sp. reilianum]